MRLSFIKHKLQFIAMYRYAKRPWDRNKIFGTMWHKIIYITVIIIFIARRGGYNNPKQSYSLNSKLRQWSVKWVNVNIENCLEVWIKSQVGLWSLTENGVLKHFKLCNPEIPSNHISSFLVNQMVWEELCNKDDSCWL